MAKKRAYEYTTDFSENIQNDEDNIPGLQTQRILIFNKLTIIAFRRGKITVFPEWSIGKTG